MPSAINVRALSGREALRNEVSNAAFSNWSKGSTFEITTSRSSSIRRETSNDWFVKYSMDRDGTTGSNNPLRVDKWYHPVGQVEVQGNNNFYLQAYNGNVSQGNSAHHEIVISQKIPRVKTLQGKSAVLSFWARGYSAGQKISVGLTQVFGVSSGQGGDTPFYDEFGNGATASYPVYVLGKEVTLPTDWTRQELRYQVPSITGKEIGVSGSNYLELNFYLQAGASAASVKNLPSGISWGGETFEISNVQLEQGVELTEFENIQNNSPLTKMVGAHVTGIASGQITNWASSVENALALNYSGVTLTGAGVGAAHYVNLNDTSSASGKNGCLKYGQFYKDYAGEPVVTISPSVSGQDTLDELYDIQTLVEPTSDKRVVKVTSFSKDNDGNSLNRLFNIYAMQLTAPSTESTAFGNINNAGDRDIGGGGRGGDFCDENPGHPDCSGTDAGGLEL
tara:strand:- start:2386 stop:3738 length:1353 start_codon:yes stop_codon:yes gene_type:complete